MHILHINLAKGFRGGERQTSLLINGLTEAFPEVKQTLLVRQNSPLPDYISGKKVSIIRSKWPILNALTSFKGVDLVHAHEAKACHLAHLLSKTNSLPYLITRRMDRSPKQRFLTQLVYKNVSRVACLSSAIQTIMQNYDSQLKTEVIPSMVASLSFDTEEIKKIRNKIDHTGKKIIVGHVGALVKKHKGQQTIIEAAKILAKKNSAIHFALVGTGQDEDILKEQAAGLDNVEFMGFKTNVGDYLRAFDIFLFPSLQEGLGSTILDAMQAERPIIASFVGGIPDLITGQENGLLIPPEDPLAIIDAIEFMLSNKSQTEQWVKTGAEKVKQYSPAVISQRYMQTYQQILDKA